MMRENTAENGKLNLSQHTIPQIKKQQIQKIRIAIALIIVLIGCTFSLLLFTENDGARTSSGAVNEFLTSLESADIYGFLQTLPPSERDVLVQYLPKIDGEMQRLSLVKNGVSAFGNTQSGFHVEMLNVLYNHVGEKLEKGVVRHRLDGGTLTISIDPSLVSETPALRDFLEQQSNYDDATSLWSWEWNFTENPLDLVVLDEDGGWHVSLVYSMVERNLFDRQRERPNFGKGPDAIGSSTPKGVIDDFFHAISGHDPERLISLFYPGEARALYDYAPLFLPLGHNHKMPTDVEVAEEDAIEQRNNLWEEQDYLDPLNKHPESFDFVVNTFDAEVIGKGSRRQVRVTDLDADFRDVQGKQHFHWDGVCLVVTYIFIWQENQEEPSWRNHSCIGEHSFNPLKLHDISIDPGSGIIGPIPTFEVVERNGKWYISPVGTILGSFLENISRQSPTGVDEWVASLLQWLQQPPVLATK